MKGKMKKALSLLLASAMVVTGSNVTFHTAKAAKSLPLSEKDGYTAFLMFTDHDWAWGNWGASSDSGWGNDAVITGDGTYTVSIDKESYLKELNKAKDENDELETLEDIKPANGATCFMIDFQGMAEAQNFDVSNIKVKDVTVKCDGKEFRTDPSKMYFGDIENKGNLRLEICNQYGWNSGDFVTKEEFDPDDKFTFEDTLSVTFTLEGIKEGKTPKSTFVEEIDGEECSLVRPLYLWNDPQAPKPTKTPKPTKNPADIKDLPLSEKDGYSAFLMFTDNNWTWGNWGVSPDSGWGNDAVITGDGTYTVSIDKESYLKELNKAKDETDELETLEDIKPASGAKCFMIDFQGMAQAENFDISGMKIKDVVVKCDGKVFPTDSSKMYFGDIENKGNLRLEIANAYGYSEGDFLTAEEFDPDNQFTFDETLSVTFTLEGIEKGETPEGLFTQYDGRYTTQYAYTLDQWNDLPKATPLPKRTKTPADASSTKKPAKASYTKTPADKAKDLPLSEKDGYTAFLMFTDSNWTWGNWMPASEMSSSDSGWGNDAVITGDGTYTVSIDKKGYEKYLMSRSASREAVSVEPAEGTMCFMVDFVKMAKAQNFDLSNMKIKNVIIKCDGKEFKSDASKMYFGDIEGRGTLRLEIRNEYGYDYGEFETKDEFDPDGKFGFEDSLSVTFTLEGIQKGNTMENVFYDMAGDCVVWAVDQWNAREIPAQVPASPTLIPEEKPDGNATAAPTMKPGENTKPTKAPVVTGTPSAAPENDVEVTPTEAPEKITKTPVVTESPVNTVAPTTVPTVAPTAAPTAVPTPIVTAEPEDEDADEEYEDVDEGQVLEDKSGTVYTITKTGKNAEVEYTAPKDNAKGTVKIPSKITANGISYKVTSVADDAFRNNSDVKKIVLNSNITSIGSNAFRGCKNLKVITITSTKLTKKSISKNAFKGISGKVVIKVPKGMKKKYKKLFQSKGLSKKVKFI